VTLKDQKKEKHKAAKRMLLSVVQSYKRSVDARAVTRRYSVHAHVKKNPEKGHSRRWERPSGQPDETKGVALWRRGNYRKEKGGKVYTCRKIR